MSDSNPKILSLESSGETCGVVLSEGEKILANYSIFGRNVHDKMLAENVRRALADKELRTDDLDAVAASAGPGSFTGLRIGGSIAKALCYGGQPKFIAVPTMDALAKEAWKYHEISGFEKIVVIIQAYKDHIYLREYDHSAEPIDEIEQKEFKDVDILKLKDTLVCGPGSCMLEDIRQPGILCSLSAEYIAKHAYTLYQKNQFTDPEKFTPLYVREFQPKMKRKDPDI